MSKKDKDKEIIENTAESGTENNAGLSEVKEKKPKKPRNTKKLKYGSASIVVVVLVIAYHDGAVVSAPQTAMKFRDVAVW